MLRLEDFAKKQRSESYEVIKNALSGITSMPIIIPTNGEINVAPAFAANKACAAEKQRVTFTIAQ